MPEYCRECGLPLEMYVQRADKVNIDTYCFGGITRNRLASPYDKFTGKENLANIYECPKYKRYWLWGSNSHDKIINYKGELHYD